MCTTRRECPRIVIGTASAAPIPADGARPGDAPTARPAELLAGAGARHSQAEEVEFSMVEPSCEPGHERTLRLLKPTCHSRPPDARTVQFDHEIGASTSASWSS
jgi:hypothetical protein